MGQVVIERMLMVVGCREGSLGDAIGYEAEHMGEFTRGVVYCEHPDRLDAMGRITHPVPMDVTNRKSVVVALEKYRPTDIVCTAGINLPDGEAGELQRNMSLQLQTNAWGPVQLLTEALDMWNRSMLPPETGFNFAMVSSNSAHVARSQSAGYCASKAALSMAVRCIARNWAETGAFHVWGYEPGFINGTPMTDEVRMRLKPGTPLHRIPGGRAMNRTRLAERIANDLRRGDAELNGCMLRLDGGDQ